MISLAKRLLPWIQCHDNTQVGETASHPLYFSTGWLTALFLIFTPWFATAQIGSSVRQVIVAQASDWNSNTATLQAYQRESARASWQPVFAQPVPVLLGRAGLAWGRGVFNPPRNGVSMKVEKDWRAPAGVFQLGSLFGYASRPPSGTRWPYIQVGPWDAYVDDSKSPYYNQHVRIDPRKGVPPWFEKQRMRLGDAAYKWMLEIRHNQGPAAPGYGSAIFFHVRRGPTKPSAGCTTMAVENLEKLIRWLDPQASPHYVLLPKADYQALRGPWRLP
ncbi:L,D-peptidoglycan transpeptidase YkuD, ErfK/YbiS/YcfS/YnhG family [Prosthecobacter debontii]|uniref:L,D-peptidoglycan transpeptidase YkuD, ErfK/YbiS/YcfS/YnhG family n=1 Tax=Prosthecobacter debontii TaxID=48467 RepID=A0A1T4YEB2_9BACT|nr:L,D-peptidoglycan transpeptidase YkuD, ErfK/YbiS/YcfS/YnhG family [Prosthecobacter debontii]